MDLLLWRHAEAFESREVSDDLDRSLTPKGERQALRMAAWLNRHLPAGAKVLVSPARRAQQTARTLDRKFKTVDALLPESSVDALLISARWPDAREPVVVVGHQPTLGLAAAVLITGEAQPWPVRKGAVWWLRARERDSRLQVTLHGIATPELL